MKKQNGNNEDVTEKIENTSKEKIAEKVTQNINIQEPVKVNLDTFASSVNLRWTAKARLEHYAQANHLKDMSIEDWQKLLKKV